MPFHYGKHTFKNKERGQEQCYLLTNGLGGYSAMTIIQSLTRCDHGLFVACTQAPTKRYVLVSKVLETIWIDERCYDLSSQEFVQVDQNQMGEQYLMSFKQDYVPCWTYLIDGVVLKKELVMVHDENTIAIRYEIIEKGNKDVWLEVLPAVTFCQRGSIMKDNQCFQMEEHKIIANGITMYIHPSPSSEYIVQNVDYVDDVYYAYDARDGRVSVGAYALPVRIRYRFDTVASADLIFSLASTVKDSATYMQEEAQRITALMQQACITTTLGKALVKASDQFITKRASVHALTIVAGYPFFTDWGRDTMYAIEGCCIATNRFEDAKAIFRTFATYMQKGLMPNMFPEQGEKPLYNTVDASLLFIQALYHYYIASNDMTFIKTEMMSVIKDILDHYQQGTAYSIGMDRDYLIQAGSGLDQVTWMDIRYQDELPTPRHGKPVEVNAYWYNALCVYAYFKHVLHEDTTFYETLASKVKQQFMNRFWNENAQCLYDVVTQEGVNAQIRCNQIWAVSTPFSPVPLKQAKAIVQTVFEKLYTPYGLRTLACDDEQFVPEYSGSLYKRDMSYHQGSVWTFPLGSYFRAYLKVHAYSDAAKAHVREQLSYFEDALEEGCVGQLPEIYDGLIPNASRGCFAQAWSVSEILKICKDVQED